MRIYEVSRRDIRDCLDALAYVASQKGAMIDAAMVEYVTEVHTRVSNHTHNENVGDQNGTISEINLLQDFLGGEDETNGFENGSGDSSGH